MHIILSLISTTDQCNFIVCSCQAVLGFLKVLALSLQAKDMQSFLPDILSKLLPWSSVSRHHFKSKVCSRLTTYGITIFQDTCVCKCVLIYSYHVFAFTGDGHPGDYDAEVWFCVSEISSAREIPRFC